MQKNTRWKFQSFVRVKERKKKSAHTNKGLKMQKEPTEWKMMHQNEKKLRKTSEFAALHSTHRIFHENIIRWGVWERETDRQLKWRVWHWFVHHFVWHLISILTKFKQYAYCLWNVHSASALGYVYLSKYVRTIQTLMVLNGRLFGIRKMWLLNWNDKTENVFAESCVCFCLLLLKRAPPYV